MLHLPIYLGVGKHVGDASSCWDRASRLPLGEVTRELVEALREGHVLEARLACTGRDAGARARDGAALLARAGAGGGRSPHVPSSQT